MENFLVDVFDICDTSRLDSTIVDTCLTVSTDAQGLCKYLISQPLFRAQLTFRFVWGHLVGCPPSKYDFEQCLADVGCAALVSSTAAFDFSVRSSYLKHVMPMTESSIGDKRDTVARLCGEHISLLDADHGLLRVYLILKWLDRFHAGKRNACTRAQLGQLCGMSLPNAYAYIVSDMNNIDDACAVLGMCVRENSTLSTKPVVVVNPTDYYRKVDGLIAAWEGNGRTLFNTNPATGFKLAASDPDLISAAAWSMNEAVRHAIVRDAHCARRVTGKTILVVPECSTGSSAVNATKNTTTNKTNKTIADDLAHVQGCSAALVPVSQPQFDLFIEANSPAGNLVAGCVRTVAVAASSSSWPAVFHGNGHRVPTLIIVKDGDDNCGSDAGIDIDARCIYASNTSLSSLWSLPPSSSPPSLPTTSRNNGSSMFKRVWPQSPIALIWPSTSTSTNGINKQDSESLTWQALLRQLQSRKAVEHLRPILIHRSAPHMGELAFLDFLGKYACRALLELELERPKRLRVPKHAKRTILMIDSRENVLSALSVLLALANLRPGEWAVHVATTREAMGFYCNLFQAHVEDVAAINFLLPDSMTPRFGEFDRDAYNALLKSPPLWRSLLPAEEVLTVQDDGFLLRPGLEERFCGRYGYTGAPWRACPENEDLKRLANPGQVGNGGLSLRSVPLMISICEKHAATDGASLFLSDTQPLPEDVFFSGAVHKNSLGQPKTLNPTPPSYLPCCPRTEAMHFSVEQEPCMAALGVHRFWMYHDLSYVEKHLTAVLTFA
jgi:Protein of unknown function (DUF5672)